MSKKVIAFDLDDTLAVTKSPISDRMSSLLGRLLSQYEVCIISGGKFEQFKTQVVDRLEVGERELSRLHLMPTCGTRYHRYDQVQHEWVLQYAEDLTDDEKRVIIETIEKTAQEQGLWVDQPYGEIIEDRGSQITYSALGQQAPPEAKYQWASDNAEKKQVLRNVLADRLPQLEVRLGGTTSVDITRIGIDKAYGMKKLISALSINKDDILFIGDKLNEGGNDYPVKAMGIDTIAVDRWEDTAFAIEGIVSVA